MSRLHSCQIPIKTRTEHLLTLSVDTTMEDIGGVSEGLSKFITKMYVYNCVRQPGHVGLLKFVLVQGVKIISAIWKIVIRHILFF